MAAVLKEKYGFEVKLLLDREATKEAIYRELRGLTVSTKANDSVLIYFAGHGDLDRTYDGGWWIPADAIGGNPVTYLDNVQVQKAMRSMKARHVLLVSDACYSGTLFRKARGLPPVIDDKYYLSLYNEKSRWGMTSGNKTPVSDQGTGGHSVFAYQLIKELGKSDKPFLSTHELYARIAPVIANNSEQTPICRPILNTGDQGGEFVFVASVKKEPPLTIPKVHQSTINKDMLYWQSVKDSNDPVLLDAYLKTFPNGIFAVIAKRKIEAFKQKEVPASIPPVVLKSKLFVEVKPGDARVRILNIRPKFHQGMALDPGSYHTEVTRSGYKTERMWTKLEPGKNATLRFSLERESVPQAEASNKQTLKHSTPVMPSSEKKISGRDGIYVAYANGIVKNTNTGLEWKAGPNKNTSWEKARAWVRSLNLDGGGWRMPTKDEVKSLYMEGAGNCNMTPLLKTTAWWVWSNETKNSPLETTGLRTFFDNAKRALFSSSEGSSYAWIFYFSDGYGYWLDRSTSDNLRAFAVRSRSDRRISTR